MTTIEAKLRTEDGRTFKCVLEPFRVKPEGIGESFKLVQIPLSAGGLTKDIYTPYLLEEKYSKDYILKMERGETITLPFRLLSIPTYSPIALVKTYKPEGENKTIGVFSNKVTMRIPESGKDENVRKKVFYLTLGSSSGVAAIDNYSIKFHGRILDSEGNPSFMEIHGREIVDVSMELSAVVDHSETDHKFEVELKGETYKYELKSFHQNIDRNKGEYISSFRNRANGVVVEAMVAANSETSNIARLVTVSAGRPSLSEENKKMCRDYLADLIYTLSSAPNGSDIAKLCGEVRKRHNGNSRLDCMSDLEGRSEDYLVYKPGETGTKDRYVLGMQTDVSVRLYGNSPAWSGIEDWADFDTTNHLVSDSIAPFILLPSGMKEGTWDEFVRCAAFITAEDEVTVPREIGEVSAI